jgi:hypothetical protein
MPKILHATVSAIPALLLALMVGCGKEATPPDHSARAPVATNRKARMDQSSHVPAPSNRGVQPARPGETPKPSSPISAGAEPPKASPPTSADSQASVSKPAKPSAPILSPPGAKLAAVTLTPGWATFGQVLPRGAAKGGLQVGKLRTQTDVKTRWADGSIRFAVLTCKVEKAGQYPITASSASTGGFSPRLPEAAVLLHLQGITYHAVLSRKAPGDRWLSGPEVVEGRCVVAPAEPGGAPHPSLRVVFDVRSYNDGSSRLDVAVENCRNVKGARNVTYSVDVFTNGQNVYHHDTLTHYYLTRWRKVFAVGLTESQVTPDFEPAQKARALPRYLPLVPNTVDPATGPKFDILQPGSLTAYMPTTGGRPEIAPYPDWVARYLKYGNPAQGKFVLANGDLGGSWPIHLREADGSFVSIDQRPNFILTNDARAVNQGFEVPVGDMSNLGPLTPDAAHTPSLAYVPYLVTGDRYYADEMGFWGAWGLASAWPQYRKNSEGLIYPSHGQERSLAWQLRNLVDPAAYLPDANPFKAYFAAKVTNNLTWLDRYAASHQTPLHSSFENTDRTQHPIVSLFQHGYLSWAIDHANNQGFRGGRAAQEQIAKFILQLFTSAPDYPHDCTYAYVLQVGTTQPGKGVAYYTTMKQLFEANFPKRPAVAREYSYSAQLRYPLATAVRIDLPGARAAFKRNEDVATHYLPAGPGWAIQLPSDVR